MNTETVETAISRLEPSSSVETIADTLGLLQGIEQRVKELKAEWKQRMIELVRERGAVEIGTKRYFIGNPKDTDCVAENGTVLDHLFTATGGDMAAVGRALCSQPFKHGHCRTVLPADVYAACFKTTTKEVLKEGVAQPQLVEADTRFLQL